MTENNNNKIRMSNNGFSRRHFFKNMAICVGLIAFFFCSWIQGGTYKSEPFKFVQMCDPQFGMRVYERDVRNFKQAVKQINTLKPDFVVICGDLVHEPDEKSFADFNKIKAGFSIPCYCVVGNHDIGKKTTIESLNYYRKIIGKDYYSFEHKGSAFIIINTQLWISPVKEELEKQDSWLKKTIMNVRKKNIPVFVAGHDPLYRSKFEEKNKKNDLPVKKSKELMTLFQQYGVIAFLTGHTHKLIINEYEGIQLVSGETTSNNFDKRPYGFRLWSVDPQSKNASHEFVPLD